MVRTMHYDGSHGEPINRSDGSHGVIDARLRGELKCVFSKVFLERESIVKSVF